MKKLFLGIFWAVCCVNLPAQHTLYKGVVTDARYKTPVAYASVFLEKAPVGTIANNVGEFLLQVPDSLAGSRWVIIREGFVLKRVMPAGRGETPVHIELQPEDWMQQAIDSQPFPFQKQTKTARFLTRALSFVLNDWIALGNPDSHRWDLGRIQTFPTYNPIEGLRLRAGLASNSRLSPHFFLKGYVAYGFKDKRVKYRGEAVYSFDKKAYHEDEFPKNNVRLVYENDLYSPGELHPRSDNDLLLVTYLNSTNETTYRRFVEARYEKEHKNGLAETVWLRQSKFVPQGALTFTPTRPPSALPANALQTAEVGVELRYSVREAYVQQHRRKTPLDTESPVFFLSHSVGVYGGPKNRAVYHRTDFSVQKRFVFREWGRLDAVGEFSKVWNAVPFPLLVYPNQRYRRHIENNAFFLNKSLEFMADEQYTLRATFVGNNFLLARIPFLNRFSIRETASFRASYGRLSPQNNPSLSSHTLYRFPPTSCLYRSVPYLEGSIGITQFLGLFRVEYVHRFTHRAHMGAELGEIRVDITL